MLRRMDPLEQRLAPAPDCEAVRVGDGSGGERWILKNRAAGSYVALAREEYELFLALAPGRSIAEVCRRLIEEKGIFPFFFLGHCLGKLRAGKFVDGGSVPVLDRVASVLHARTWRARLERFFQRTVRLSGLDPFFGVLYRALSWLYVFPVLVLLHVAAAIGVGTVLWIAFSGRLSLFAFPGGLWIELPLLLAAQGVLVFLHEMGHALTVKWAGREVDRAGVSLALLLPVAFFVDTNDMWLSPGKGRKMAVSWAGPFVHLLGAAACGAALPFLSPSGLAASVLYKTAVVALLLVFLNLNPLLTTDGYFLLADALGVPNLARRARDFWSGGGWRKWLSGTPTREEKILAVFGGSVAVWSMAATAISFIFLAGFARLALRLWEEGGTVARSVVLALAALVVLPFGYFAFGLTDRATQRLLGALERSGFLRDRKKLVALAACDWVLLLAPPALGRALDLGVLGRVEVAAVWYAAVALAAAALSIWSVRRILRHRWHEVSFRVLCFFLLLLAVRAFAALPLGGAPLGAHPGALEIAWAAAALLPHAILPALMLVWAIAAGRWAVIALTLRGGRFRVGLALVMAALGLGLVSQFAAIQAWGELERGAAAFSGLVLLTALVLVALELDRVRFERPREVDTLLLSDEEKLRRAFAVFVERTIHAVREYFGDQKAAAVARAADRELVSRGYGLRVASGKVEDRTPAHATIFERGQVYGDAFGALLDQVVRQAGWGFADRLLESLHDSLYWAEREVVTTYLFRGKRWDAAGTVVRAEAEPLEFFRGIPLFYAFQEEDLSRTIRACQVCRYAPGETILREGDLDRDLYILRRGIVDVFAGGQRVNSLGEGDYFGEIALVEDRPRTATVAARTVAECYRLGRDAFDSLVRPALGTRVEMLTAIQRVGALSQFGIFGNAPPGTLAGLLQESEVRTVRAGDRVLVQGEIGRHFYLILDGSVRVVLEPDTGPPSEVAIRRRGEYFGEIALIQEIPRTASVYALEECELLVVSKENFDRLFKKTREIERFASRRMAVLERMARGGRAESLEA